MAAPSLSRIPAAALLHRRFSSLSMLKYGASSRFNCLFSRSSVVYPCGSIIYRRSQRPLDIVSANISYAQMQRCNFCSSRILAYDLSRHELVKAVTEQNAGAQALSADYMYKKSLFEHDKESPCSKRLTGSDESEMVHIPLYPPSARSVVIVESIAKAKVIQKYLGDMYEVLPSYGHVRDIAGRPGSIRPEEDFSIIWEVPSAAWTHLKSIRIALRGAKYLILACDPDREGEAIGWHIIEMLRQQNALRDDIVIARIVFNEITEMAVKAALKSPKNVDMDLVNAYLARRAIDYFIGFNMSPLLWKSLPGCRSAGWVHSNALSLICDREAEIEQHKPEEYWTMAVDFQYRSSRSMKKRKFSSQLTHWNSGKLDQFSMCSELHAKSISENVPPSDYEVVGVKIGRISRDPPICYVTSTLQRDAANKLKFSSSYTMQVAQRLYEGVKLSDEEATGLITYPRTAGVHVSNEVAEDIHSFVIERYGKEYASSCIKYFEENQNALENQEAIRPTSIRRLPSSLIGILDDDSLKLYTLIWTRTLACQMESTRTNMIQVEIGSAEGNITLSSVGSRVDFQGYRAVYKDIEAKACSSSDDEDGPSDEYYDSLCELRVKDALTLVEVRMNQHHTEPPLRYSEGELVKKLEELGIGRPSSYASVVKELQDRNYISTRGKLLHPEFHGRLFSAFLSHHFSEVIGFNITAVMETQLDNISVGATEWKGLVKEYWARFGKYCDLASSFDARQLEKMLDERFRENLYSSLPNNNRVCPRCYEGTLRFQANISENGYFIGCDLYPKCKYVAITFFGDDDEADCPEKKDESFPPKLLGLHPDSNEKVFLKRGPFAYYVQLGEDRKGFSPKRVSVSQVIKDVNTISLEDAVELLQYPLTLGKHPDDNYPVMLTHSSRGFSFRHRHLVAPVPKRVDPKTATLEIALKYLRRKKAKLLGLAKEKEAVKSKATGKQKKMTKSDDRP